eukprot:GHVT01016776.1.p2 GENE.GHVT01016776.1~~GHVT01016776.1.p2  ORF type:complete len:127 (-),score=28.75 GHVT01016776.1:616-996(-)
MAKATAGNGHDELLANFFPPIAIEDLRHGDELEEEPRRLHRQELWDELVQKLQEKGKGTWDENLQSLLVAEPQLHPPPPRPSFIIDENHADTECDTNSVPAWVAFDYASWAAMKNKVVTPYQFGQQ